MAMIDGPWAAPGVFVPVLTAVLTTWPRGGRLTKRLVGAASHSPACSGGLGGHSGRVSCWALRRIYCLCRRLYGRSVADFGVVIQPQGLMNSEQRVAPLISSDLGDLRLW
jgi:hypothetical protein